MTFSLDILANNLRRVRRKKGLSQRRLADMARLTNSTIANIETVRFCPRLDTVCMLAEALGMTLDELVYEVQDE